MSYYNQLYLVKPWQIVKLMPTKNFTWPEQTNNIGIANKSSISSVKNNIFPFKPCFEPCFQSRDGIGVIFSHVLILWGSVQFWMSSLHTLSDDHRYMTFAWLRKVSWCRRCVPARILTHLPACLFILFSTKRTSLQLTIGYRHLNVRVRYEDIHDELEMDNTWET